MSEDREVPQEVQDRVFALYGLDPGDPKYRINRLVPATLGGTDSPRNLFPATPWFTDLKKRLDKRLTELVNSQELSLQHARRELTGNWVQAMHGYYIRNYGHADPQKAKETEDQLGW
jgi:hypothetical protein